MDNFVDKLWICGFVDNQELNVDIVDKPDGRVDNVDKYICLNILVRTA